MREIGISDPDSSRGRRQRDAHAWHALVRRFTPQVYRLARRMLRDRAEPEDVSHDVFMRIHRAMSASRQSRTAPPRLCRKYPY